jgi:hypothetical protein
MKFWIWFFDYFSSNLPIVLTIFLGVGGIIVETKQKKDKRYFIKPNNFGVATIVFIVLVGGCGLNSQYSSYVQAKHDNDSIVNKSKLDSQDAVIKYLNLKRQLELVTSKTEQQAKSDSIGHLKTLLALQTQRTIDSLKIVTDSLHYNITDKKLAQQISEQTKTLYNINKLLHPMFPLKLSFAIGIDLKDLNPDIANSLRQKMLIDFNRAKASNPRISSISEIGKNHAFVDSTNEDSINNLTRTLIPSSGSLMISTDSNFDTYNQPNSVIFSLGFSSKDVSYNYEYDQLIPTLYLNIHIMIPENSLEIQKIETFVCDNNFSKAFLLLVNFLYVPGLVLDFQYSCEVFAHYIILLFCLE